MAIPRNTPGQAGWSRFESEIAKKTAPPIALVVLVAIGWIALARRRRAARKHEGLRVLR